MKTAKALEQVILTTGGTGGHIFPALSLAEELRSRAPGGRLLFMGGRYGQEADLAVSAGLDFVSLPVRGVRGRGGRGILALFGMVRGLFKAWAVIRKNRPELVVGFGGYAGFAGVLAARLAGVPTAIHEQNAWPGLSNRLLGKVVDRIFLSMPDEAGAFDPQKTVLVGNPVRTAIRELYGQRLSEHPDLAARLAGMRAKASPAAATSCYGGVDAPSPFDVRGRKETPDSSEAGETREERRAIRPEEPAPRRPRLLVMGGSLGARPINRAMLRMQDALREADIDIWHQTGAAEYESVRAAYRELGAEHTRVEPFITDMRRAYLWANLVLCRAGGSSMAEITAAGLPAVLVPLPHAAGDHQRHNARFLEKAGGALIVEQNFFDKDGAASGTDKSPERPEGHGAATAFARILVELLRDKARLRDMARSSLEAARPYAARDMADTLEALCAGDQPRRRHAEQN